MLQKLLNGRYQVLEALGAGGFSQTYIAQDIHRPGFPKCVVKHLKPASHDPELLSTARRLFHSEAETLEQLGTHEQIPRLLAYFEQDQEFFLVQEFIVGQTLQADFSASRPWSESQVINFLQQILSILEFVHRHNVIHRDLKPSNIIIRSDGKFVLIDFGAVKQILCSIQTTSGHTNVTVAIGTPGYMSTEQGRGKPRPSSDIYSLGIIGIQALTLLHPSQFEEDEDTGEIIFSHQANVSPQLATVLSKMVLHHFKERYQSATEVLQDVKQLDSTYVLSLPATIITQSPVSPPPLTTTPALYLAPLQRQSLEKLLTEFIGPIAATLIRQVAALSPNYSELVENLALHLAKHQQYEFQKIALLLQAEAATPPELQPDLLSNDRFVRQCQQYLADLIGPIAPLIVQKALTTSPQISRTELVKMLAAEIPDPQTAIKFQQQLLS